MTDFGNNNSSLFSCLGLMAGTSLDGVDVAHLITDGKNKMQFGVAMTLPYDTATKELIAEITMQAGLNNGENVDPALMKRAEKAVIDAHIKAISIFIKRFNLNLQDFDLVGFHGQTILHRPEMGLTVQIGDPQSLANQLGVPVVAGLRLNDLRHGGQGAPLVPVYHLALAHKLLCKRPVVFVNIGGIANVTVIDACDNMTAFDCGPGNCLLDDWVYAQRQLAYDEEGKIALAGQIDRQVVEHYLAQPFFVHHQPKSADRADFLMPDMAHLSAEDGAATLCEITARAIMRAGQILDIPPEQWVICGGGRHNKALMQALQRNTNSVVVNIDDLGCDGDAIEAQAFAYLAVRSVLELPLTFPTTTGVKKAVSGGILFRLK